MEQAKHIGDTAHKVNEPADCGVWTGDKISDPEWCSADVYITAVVESIRGHRLADRDNILQHSPSVRVNLFPNTDILSLICCGVLELHSVLLLHYLHAQIHQCYFEELFYPALLVSSFHCTSYKCSQCRPCANLVGVVFQVSQFTILYQISQCPLLRAVHRVADMG